MGVHTWEAEYRDGDYYGSDGEPCRPADGGRRMATRSWCRRRRAGLVREGSVELVDLGEHRFRDLTNLERIFQVSRAGPC